MTRSSRTRNTPSRRYNFRERRGRNAKTEEPKRLEPNEKMSNRSVKNKDANRMVTLPKAINTTRREDFLQHCRCGEKFFRGTACNMFYCTTCGLFFCWACRTTLPEDKAAVHFQTQGASAGGGCLLFPTVTSSTESVTLTKEAAAHVEGMLDAIKDVIIRASGESVPDQLFTSAVPVPGGGDCLFEALALIFNTDMSKMRGTLSRVYSCLPNDKWQVLLETELVETDRRREPWWKSWRRSTTYGKTTAAALAEFKRVFVKGVAAPGDFWGDYNTIELAAKHFDCGVQIIQDNQPRITTVNYRDAAEIAALKFDCISKHYAPVKSNLHSKQFRVSRASVSPALL